jgi:ABC-type transport system involved in multi-copper enzyme maturation permease subunit
MIRLVHIELLKLRTIRTTYGMLGIVVLLTALLTVLRATRGPRNGDLTRLNGVAGQTTVFTLVGFAMVMAMVLGAIVSSGEFRHATATLTYLTCPNRTRVLVAKAIAAAVAGLGFGAVGSGVATGIGIAFVAGHGYPLEIAGPTLVRYGIGAMLGAALLAAIGVAVGSLIRSQITVAVGILIWAFFVEAILGGFFNSAGPYLPFTASTTLAGARLGGGGFGFAGSSSARPLPFAAAAGLVAAIAVSVSLLASRTTVGTDVT